ncbi:S41 family peptidase [Sinomicrobium weinanense]|uniref:PDZ domain-containing protein n=1 Tax=Sinomicrobium weinanense TaxID=2842200 RepID=A0A926JPC9_9FLAO|nr:S41 family peptidase [Sinomicrobium weinanense]MBC9794817.1 PDZ domain-containing protein [Sinomicrobium weinanense]MBU3125076.1 PDZ domain-containing protein [Sinomicrobium weinanense]
MKKLFYLFLSGLVLWSCSDKDDDAFVPKPSGNLEVQDFIWKGLNEWYFWQGDVTDLSDTKFSSNEEYKDFLGNYSAPEDLFDHLLFRKGDIDRFSWIVDDYEELLNSFRGENETFGFGPGSLVRVNDNGDVIWYVAYVMPNSPAADAGMQRGDLIYKFDGIVLKDDENTIDQLNRNYFNNNSIKFEFATVDNGVLSPTGEEATLNRQTVQENPVHFSDVIPYEGKNIGYLVYNGFVNTYNEELNTVFEGFKNQNIDELVLDLRYNGGGSVETSTYLASMIYGEASASDIFAKSIYNPKHQEENNSDTFADKARTFDKSTGDPTGSEVQINRLTSLNRVYILTSQDTASASEMIINGLSPYMEVILIGETTYGKNVGSFTLFDAPGFGTRNINPNHKYAMQPITFTIYNKNDESDYVHGFTPDIEVREFESYEDLKPFGDTEESLLRAALNHISGLAARAAVTPESTARDVKGLKEKPFSKEMYITPAEMEP